MPEVDRRKSIGVVAFIALHVRYKMVACFARCRGSIVARGTTPVNGSMIEVGRAPGQSGMTIIALGRGLYVSRMFPCCRGSIMTTGTGSRHAAMVEINVGPTAGHMTIVTQIICRNMRL